MTDKGKIIYIALKESVIIEGREVLLKDVSDLVVADEKLMNNLKETRLLMLCKDENLAKVSATDIISIIQKAYPQLVFMILNAGDVIIRVKKGTKRSILTIKVIIVSVLCFFGSAFTIMAFENDVGTPDIFSRVYKTVMGSESKGVTALDISYSIGLAGGIAYFFHHFGHKKKKADPTPIEVSINQYETDANTVTAAMLNKEK